MSSKFIYPFGKEKGKPLDQVGKSSLVYYVKNLKLDNPQFNEKNIAFAKECLALMSISDIMKVIEEIDPTHPAWQMSNDAMNAKMDQKSRVKTALVAKEPGLATGSHAAVKHLLEELEAQIQVIYDAATEMQSTIDVFVEKDGMETRSTQEPPF